MNTISTNVKRTGLATALGLPLILAGCGGDSSFSPAEVETTNDVGVIATVADDFGSGAVELIGIEESDMTASGSYFAGTSDIAVNGYGQHYYLLRKFNADRVLKVDVENPAREVWDASALAEDASGSANPYQVVFVNDTKAYLLRYDQNIAWIVDPSATQASGFFTGDTLDLSAYQPSDTNGAVGMSAGAIVDDKLFITLQRLNSSFAPTNDSYVAVFDTETDTEIETNADADDNLKGIPLTGRNPGGIQYLEATGLIVQNIGSYSAPFEGTGLDIIDPANFTLSSMIADADIDTQISDAVILNATKGYILNYAGVGSISLQTFDPSQDPVSLTTVGSFAGADFRDIELGPDGRLWLADARVGNPGVQVIDTSDDSVSDFIQTTLLPNDITFAEIDISF
jgi:hypothetical protein